MRDRIAALVFVFAACGTEVEPSVDPTPSPLAATTREAAEAPSALTIGGRLRAHDGAPLRAAEFTVHRSGFTEPVARGALADDGSFHVEVPEPGIYSLSVAAVDHAQLAETLLVDRAIEVHGDLGTYAREDPGETLRVKAEFLRADGDVMASGPTTAARTAHGVYRLDLKDRPKDAVKLRYQLVGGGGRTYNGPLADDFESDGGGDYWSVIAVGGRDTIDLALAGMPPAGKAAQLTWRGEPPELIAQREYLKAWQPKIDRLRAAMPRTDGKVPAPGEQEKAEMAALAAEALAEADAAATDDARMLLRLAHLDLFLAYDDDAAARARAEWILERVDPTDPRLGLFWNVQNSLFRAAKAADEAFSGRLEAWLVRAQDNPTAETALGALEFLMHRADERGDDARVADLYALVRAPRFAGTYTAKRLAERFDPDRLLQRGKPFPDFAFPALAADAPPITRAERAGRLYLVEFWATWCGPCVADMPDLHATYAAVNGARPGKGKGEDGMRRLAAVDRPKIEFVFVSLDQSPDDVRAFRDRHWSMPWTHAFVGRDAQKEVMARYGFSGVPTAILVDGDGAIVEVGAALRRERLLPALERALAAVRAPAP